MATDAEVLAQLWRLRLDELQLDDFEEWFVEWTLDVDTPLVRQVSGILAESAGTAFIAEAVARLERMLWQPTVVVPPDLEALSVRAATDAEGW